jgi:hypothetical protein
LPRSHNWKRSNPQGTVVPDTMCSWKIQNLRQRLQQITYGSCCPLTQRSGL